MTGSEYHQPVPNDGDQIKHRVVARLDAAHLDIVAACSSTGCRVAALLGDDELTFLEAVALADLLGCSPAAFFGPIEDIGD